MYFFISLLLSCAVIFSCAAVITGKKRTLLRITFILDLALLAAGIACLIAASVQTGSIFSNTALDESYRAWASDAYSLWVRTSGIFSAVIGGVLLLAAAIRHPMVKIRTFVSASIPILLLVGGGIYAVFVENEVADLVTDVYLWTVGCACLAPVGVYLDTVYSLFFPSHAEKRKK